MADFRRLLQFFQEELGRQEEVLRILARERTAIVHLNQDEIEKVTELKQRLFEELQSRAQKRQEEMLELNRTLKGPEPLELHSLLEKCSSSELREQIALLGQELKKSIAVSQEMNQHNGQLIRKTLGIISSTMAIFQGASIEGSDTYSAAGEMKHDDELAPATRNRSLCREV